MIKTKSKNRIKQASAFTKKGLQAFNRTSARKISDKENGLNSLRFTQALIEHKNHKKQNNNSTEVSTKNKNKSSSHSKPPKKGKDSKKLNDQDFIEKLFSKTQNVQKQSCFVEQLMQEIVVTNDKKNNYHTDAHDLSKILTLQEQVEAKNRETRLLKRELEELKLYVSSFLLRVFDLSVICKKNLNTFFPEKQKTLLSHKLNEVVTYIESLVRQWNLEEKIKAHTEQTFKKSQREQSGNPNELYPQNRKRCHTQSLKIPLEEYMQDLNKQQNKQNFRNSLANPLKPINNLEKLQLNKKTDEKYQLKLPTPISIHEKPDNDNDEESEIMRIVSRRNSEIKKQDDEVYVVLRSYQTSNVHELKLRAGDRIMVVDKTNAQRWVGLKDGAIGYFPKDILF